MHKSSFPKGIWLAFPFVNDARQKKPYNEARANIFYRILNNPSIFKKVYDVERTGGVTRFDLQGGKKLTVTIDLTIKSNIQKCSERSNT